MPLPPIFPLLFLVLSVPAPAKIVRPIEVPSGQATGGIVLVHFFSGGHLRAPPGMAVVDANGRPVPFRPLGHDFNGATSLAVDLRNVHGPTFLQYGPQPNPLARLDPDLPVSLVLRTFSLRRGLNPNINSLPRAIESARPLGTALLDNINLAHNPFGPDQHFITDIQGLLKVDRAKTFRFFSANDDAAFVLIDGKVLISQSSTKLTRSSESLARQSTEVHLSKGEHRIRYIHVQREGRSVALLGLIVGQRAWPVPRKMYVRHGEANLGEARSDPVGPPPVGFDARQLDQLSHGGHVFTRFRLAPIAAAPPGHRFRWNFGDHTSRNQDGDESGRPAVQHVYRHHEPDPTWALTLELIDNEGGTIGKAAGVLRPATFRDIDSSDNRRRTRAYAIAMANAEYDRAAPELLEALYDLAAVLEQPALIAPVAEAYGRRFANRRSWKAWEIRYALATHLARDHPRRAAELFGRLARQRGLGQRRDGKNRGSWKSMCAAAEQLDLLIFRLGQTDQLQMLFNPLLSNRSARELCLLKSRLGDVHRLEGDLEKAEQAYRAAQRVATRQMEPHRAAVLQTSHLETALAYLEQRKYPAMREVLFQWEADFPMAKLGGDLPLLTGRYFQAIGDDPRAVLEFQSLLQFNPLHPSKPEILYRLAQSLAGVGQEQQARELMDQLASQFPNSPYAGRSLNRMGKQ